MDQHKNESFRWLVQVNIEWHSPESERLLLILPMRPYSFPRGTGGWELGKADSAVLQLSEVPGRTTLQETAGKLTEFKNHII